MRDTSAPDDATNKAPSGKYVEHTEGRRINANQRTSVGRSASARPLQTQARSGAIDAFGGILAALCPPVTRRVDCALPCSKKVQHIRRDAETADDGAGGGGTVGSRFVPLPGGRDLLVYYSYAYKRYVWQ